MTNAQDKEKSNSSSRKINPGIKMPMLDTTVHRILSNSMTFTQSTPVPIPNALDRRYAREYHNMPILKLNGQNLAPMPGADSLDRFVNERDTSIRPILRIKKIF